MALILYLLLLYIIIYFIIINNKYIHYYYTEIIINIILASIFRTIKCLQVSLAVCIPSDHPFVILIVLPLRNAT